MREGERRREIAGGADLGEECLELGADGAAQRVALVVAVDALQAPLPFIACAVSNEPNKRLILFNISGTNSLAGLPTRRTYLSVKGRMVSGIKDTALIG